MRNEKGYKVAIFRNGLIIACKSVNQLKRECKKANKEYKCGYKFTEPQKNWFNI